MANVLTVKAEAGSKQLTVRCIGASRFAVNDRIKICSPSRSSEIKEVAGVGPGLDSYQALTADTQTLALKTPLVSDYDVGTHVFSLGLGLKSTFHIPDDDTVINSGLWDFVTFDRVTVRTIVIPSSVTSIGDSTFEGCSALVSVTIPLSVTSIGDYAFNRCRLLARLVIPSSVTSIGHRAFAYCSSLASLEIASSVTSIGDCAFRNTSLASLTIPPSVTSIGDGTFYDCTLLISVAIPPSVTSIGDCAFYDCRSLASLTIPSSVTRINMSTFNGCSSLVSLAIPSSVTSIRAFAFNGCSSLASLAIPTSVIWIGHHAFNGCSSLASLAIPSTVFGLEIGVGAFEGCSSLRYVILPSSVTRVRREVFEGCSSLATVEIPASVRLIEERAFNECSSLTTVVFNSFMEITPSVTSIGDSAFFGCSALASFEIPSSVTDIGDNAFKGCTSFRSITIPPSVARIGECAFDGCTSVDFAIIKGYDTSLDGTPFKDCSNLRIVILPAKKYTKDIFLGCPKLELVSAFCPNPKPLAIASDEDAPFTLILTGNDEKAIEALQQFRKAQLKEDSTKQSIVRKIVDARTKSYANILFKVIFKVPPDNPNAATRLRTSSITQRQFEFALLVSKELTNANSTNLNFFGPRPGLGRARSLYPYTARSPDELTFESDVELTILTIDHPKLDKGWWKGRLNGQIGIFPANYVKRLDESDTPAIRGRWSKSPLPDLPEELWRHIFSFIDRRHPPHAAFMLLNELPARDWNGFA